MPKEKIKIAEALNYLFRTMRILATGGKGYLVVIVFFALIFGVVPSLSILIMQEIVNTLQMGESDLNYILILIAVYIGVDFFSGLLGMVASYIDSVLQMKASVVLNLSVVEKVEELSLKDFENSKTYDLIQRAKGIGIGQLFSFFKSFILVFQSLITLIAFSLILLAWRWWLIPVVFIVPIISTFVTAYFGKKQFLIQKHRAGKERKRWYFQYLLTNDIAFKEIKIFNIGNYFREKYKQLSLEFLGQDKKLLNERTFVQSLLMLLDQAVNAVLFIYVITRTFIGEILLGDMIAYTRSISKVKSSVQGFLAQINSIYQNVLYISQYFEFIDMKSETLETTSLLENKDIDSQSSEPLSIPFIELKNLSYKYKGQNRYALKNVNLKIEQDSLIALIGQNGSGKTTLVKILSTLYNDYEGEVYFGNKNLRDINPENVKKKVGLLFQDFVKYELTVRENIAMGQLEKLNDDKAITQSLLKTGMLNKFTNLDYQLGFWFEDGIQMSGGEWLKIALSRAFIRDAELFLLDEPNAALDPMAERQILKSFKDLSVDKIGIIISHRIASIKDIADKIIVFDNGSIQAVGNHESLMQGSDKYREMYNSEEGID